MLQETSGAPSLPRFTVTFGIVAFVLAGGFVAWMFQEIRDATIDAQIGHIQIVRPRYFERGIAAPYRFLLPETSTEKNP